MVEVRVEPFQFEFEVPINFHFNGHFFHEDSVVGSAGKTSYFKEKSLLLKFLEGNWGKGKIRSEFRKNSHA